MFLAVVSTISGVLFVKNHQWDLFLLKWGEKFLQVRFGMTTHRICVVRREVLRIDDDWEQAMNRLLEVTDVQGERSNEGLMDEGEVHEEVVPNENMLLATQGLDNSSQLLLDGRKLVFRILASLASQPLRVNSR